MTTAPNYTEEGQYTVYYEITYTYKDKSMTEDGAANVWLRAEGAGTDDCPCGCGDPDCGCQDNNCGGGCRGDKNCNNGKHHFTLLDRISPTWYTLGYDRCLCSDCGRIKKRDYTNALDHAMQSIVVREATCEASGKVVNICKRCGLVETEYTEKGGHQYKTYTIKMEVFMNQISNEWLAFLREQYPVGSCVGRWGR